MNLERSPHRARTALAAAGLAAAGLLALGVAGLTTGAAAFLAGLSLALLPVPLYVALVLWLDRYEKEPVGTLAMAFGWGAGVAVLLALVWNAASAAAMAVVAGPEVAEIGVPLLSAPVVEESTKAIALLLLYVSRRRDFDNVTDGIVYAGMVGLGFATVENVFYYGHAWAEGGAAPAAAFVLRGVISPFGHPLFTAMVGIGLGLARERRRTKVAAVAPTLGLVAAIGLHALWNLSATLGAAFFFAYALVMVPAFVGTLALVGWSLARERRVLATHLAPLVESGDLSAVEHEALTSPAGRWRAARAAYRAGGWRGLRRHRAATRALGRWAFARWRESRGLAGPRSAERAEGALERFRALRRPPLVGAALLLAVALGCGDDGEPAAAAGRVGQVVEARDTAPAVQPAPATDGVTVAGAVRGQASSDPIAGAYVIVLRPGVPFETWEASAGEETEALIQAAVRADSTGAWRVPSLPRGETYTVMIAARGYRTAAFDLGLTVEPEAPAIVTMEPVGLERAVW